VGNKSAKPVFEGATPFDIVGEGYQRPFELATLRLFNMVGAPGHLMWRCLMLQ
jgi:hypothetical protein